MYTVHGLEAKWLEQWIRVEKSQVQIKDNDKKFQAAL
jgi:hypothetical protein